MTASEALRHSRIALSHGSGAIPVVGFGTLIPDLAATKQATTTALEVGFRHFDCAERYRNEQAVGEALREAFDAGTIAREDVFVTTKLWNSNHRPERVRPAYEASCRRLQVDYADCYLIHTPYAFAPGDDQDPRDEHGNVIYDDGVTLAQTWQALEHLVDDGALRRYRLIGHLAGHAARARRGGADQAGRRAGRIASIPTRMGAARLLPRERDCAAGVRSVRACDAAKPSGRQRDYGHRERLQMSPAQVALSWAAQRGSAFLTTSTKPQRIQENYQISPLPDDAMSEIRDHITTNIRFNSVVQTGVPGFIPRPTDLKWQRRGRWIASR